MRFAMYVKEMLLRQSRFTMCGRETLFNKMTLGESRGLFCRKVNMIERGLYYASLSFAKMVREVGGQWNDTKHRPIVCLVKSKENDNIYWAVPMGNFHHRTEQQIERLNFYLNLPKRDIRSCYYHVGRTTNKSIFFISDAVPITEKYIAEEHLDINKHHFVIKNPKLIAELQRKLFRVLAIENSKPNCFRQHITDIKKFLLSEL